MKAVRRKCEDFYICKKCFENQDSFVHKSQKRVYSKNKRLIRQNSLMDDDNTELATQIDFEDDLVNQKKYRSDEGIGVGGVIACEVRMNNRQ